MKLFKQTKTMIGSLIPRSTSGSVLFIDSDRKLAQDNDNLFWDATNERLGIGTNAPKEKVHIYTDDSGRSTIDGSADELVLENDANCGMTILCNSANKGSIYWGDEDGAGRGRLIYDHSVDDFEFYRAGTLKMNINGTGVDIVATRTGATANIAADDLVIDHAAGGAGITILTNNDTSGYLFFGDVDDTDVTGFRMNHSTNEFFFKHEGSNRMVMNSAGQLTIGAAAVSNMGRLFVSTDIDGISLAFGTNAISYPTTPAGYALVGGAGASHLRISLTDGSGRSNFYWNAYYETAAGAHKAIVGAERSVNFEIGNGYFQIMNTLTDATDPGDIITWFIGYELSADGTVYVKKDLIPSSVIINRAEGGTTSTYQDCFSSTAGHSSTLIFRRAYGTESSRLPLQTSADISQILFQGHDGSSLVGVADIKVEAENNYSVGNTTSRINFRVWDDNASALVEYIRLSGLNNSVTINRTGADIDFIVEGDTDEDLLYVNAGTDRIGINTSTPNSKLQVDGSLAAPIVTKTSNYTIDDTDFTILLDGTSNTVTATLPTASGITGRIYNIKCIDATNTCDVATNGSEEIDGDSTNFELILHEVITVQSDGSNWWII